MESRNETPVISSALRFYHKENTSVLCKLEVTYTVETLFAVEAKKSAKFVFKSQCVLKLNQLTNDI